MWGKGRGLLSGQGKINLEIRLDIKIASKVYIDVVSKIPPCIKLYEMRTERTNRYMYIVIPHRSGDCWINTNGDKPLVDC